MTHSLENKLKRCIRPDKRLRFKTSFSTTKVHFFTNNKDKTPDDYKANVVYRFSCPGCSATYIGKTERNLQERCIEHATRKDSVIFDHLRECAQLNYLRAMLLFDINNITREDQRLYYINLVKDNTKIIDSAINWSNLLIKEALYIKRHKPILNSGLKASRELYLFS